MRTVASRMASRSRSVGIGRLSSPLQYHRQQRLLCMQAVFRLVEDDGLRPGQHLVPDLLPPGGRRGPAPRPPPRPPPPPRGAPAGSAPPPPGGGPAAAGPRSPDRAGRVSPAARAPALAPYSPRRRGR